MSSSLPMGLGRSMHFSSKTMPKPWRTLKMVGPLWIVLYVSFNMLMSSKSLSYRRSLPCWHTTQSTTNERYDKFQQRTSSKPPSSALSEFLPTNCSDPAYSPVGLAVIHCSQAGVAVCLIPHIQDLSVCYLLCLLLFPELMHHNFKSI